MTSETRLTHDLRDAVAVLQAGQPVAIPTETVYGLAANAHSIQACKSIYEAKQRPSDNPLIVHVSSFEMLQKVLEPTLWTDLIKAKEDKNLEHADPLVKRILKLSSSLWPGPLTLICPKHPELIPQIVTGSTGLDTVAVRMPSHSLARQLIDACGFPLAAPSANLSGRPSPTRADHVMDDLQGRIPLVLDGGPCTLGVESTVLDITTPCPTILRPGSITQTQLETALAEPVQHFGEGQMDKLLERPPTPGLKYRHYSPTAPVYLCMSRSKADELYKLYPGSFLIAYGGIEGPNYLPLAPNPEDYELIARNLFAVLRDADSCKPTCIIVQGCESIDQGIAVMNRLTKAATHLLLNE